MRRCRICHHPLPPTQGRGRKRAYCSKTCKQAAYRACKKGTLNKKQGKPEASKNTSVVRMRTTCLVCGNPLHLPTGKGRKPTYCSATCRQKDYRARQKRHEFRAQHLLRNYQNVPVLSLFPGIGLFDMAFEELGFLVVRGPDLLWGGNIRTFHPTKGYFQGVIGGPPCQAFSRLRYFVEYNGLETAPNLIPEFERCVQEAQPVWFLMENVPAAPLPVVDGYIVHSQLLDNRETGGVQQRLRRISFGTHDGRPLLLSCMREPAEYAPAVMANGYYKDEHDPTSQTGHTSKKILARMMELQGLPDGFMLPGMGS